MSTQDGKWWQKAWNPIHVKGGGWYCTKCSPGCKNCWCYSYNKRFGNGASFDDLDFDSDFFPGFELDQRILEAPFHWRKPQVIATCWLGDIFHEQIPISFVDEILEVIRQAKQHAFLVLTKRPQNFSGCDFKNLWLGLSISIQQEANEKIPILLQTPAVHRYVNLEPMLEGIDLTNIGITVESDYRGLHDLDWVLLGAESGPGRRPMKLEWARNIAQQCKAAGIPLWVKQIDINGKVSKKMEEWEPDLRVRGSGRGNIGAAMP